MGHGVISRPALLVLLTGLAVAGCRGRRAEHPFESPDYPAAPAVDACDVHHGVKVPDPYRWLEDLDSEATRSWIAAQSELTRSYLGSGSARGRVRDRLEELWDYERFSVPFREGGRYFFQRNEGLQDQSVLYVAESLEAEPRVLLDPNGFSEDGTISLRGTDVSRDGRFLAYGVSRAGSDWREIAVRDIETGVDLEADRLRWIKFSGAAWDGDGSGFYYTRLPEVAEEDKLTARNLGMKVCYHRIGTSQDEDETVYERPDHPDWSFSPEVTEDGRYLVIGVGRAGTSNNAIFVSDLETGGPVVEVLPAFDADYTVLGNDGPRLYVWTDREAPFGRIVAVDLANPAPDAWRELVPEDRHAIAWATLVGDRIVLQKMAHAHSRVAIHALDGSPEGELPLPGPGSTWGFRGRRDSDETFFSFSGFVFPPRVYRVDLETRSAEVWKSTEVEGFDPDRFVSEQVTYRSKDGVWVTMFLSHRKGLRLDGNNPTLLNGYGGFGIPMLPRFSVATVVWMELGGVHAIPNLRGGGEYGEAWHRAGMKERKQAVFDDFIAAAQALIDNGYTSPERLAISGGSNGGLLVGAMLAQRPDLFGAAIPSRGLLDMIRFERFTIGWHWAGEYGSVEDEAQFRNLLAYSPYHNLRAGTRYPATLITTADHDDRVVPAHSYKFAARLQACQVGEAPILLRVESRAGHGGGMPTHKVLDEVADKYAFLAKSLRMRVPRRIR